MDPDRVLAGYLARLVDGLRLAAVSVDQQIAALPDFVHVPDEAALHFDDAYVQLVPQMRDAGLLSAEQLDALALLDEQYDRMSEASDRDWVWTIDAMRSDPRWAKSRELARAALALLGQPLQEPTLDGVTYVRGEG